MSEKIVQLNEEVIKGQIKELVRGSVEETLNELLEAEAEKLTQAARYERNEQRQGYRSGHYSRNLTTTSGDVTLKVPKLKGISFETAIIERYRRRESSVEEALIEMYLAGVSVRRVEDITEALWGSKVSPSTISELNKKAYVHIEDWRNRPLLQGGRYPYVYVDGIYLRRNWGGEFENVAILVAIAVNEDGYREVLGAAEGMKEDKASWVSFFQWLRPWPGRRQAGGWRQVPRYAGGCGRSIPRSQVPALHRPLLPQCVLCHASLQGEAGGKDAQGDPRPGKQEGCP
jgi:putative transposase